MDTDAARLVEHLAAALSYVYTDDEDRARRSPPYPLPAALESHRAAIVDALRAATTEDREVRIVPRTLTPERPLMRGDVDGSKPYNFADAAIALVAVGAIGLDDAHRLLPLLPPSSGMRRQLVVMHRDAGRLDKAEAEIVAMGDDAWLGWRDLARGWARDGDADSFFRHWSKYASAKERTRMDDLKRELVDGITRRRGWRQALDAVRSERRLGDAWSRQVLATAGRSMSSGELVAVFAREAAGVLTRTTELEILLDALRRETSRGPEDDPALLAGILDELIAIDPTTSRDVMRRRDHLLFSSWPVIGRAETLARVRAAVRTPDLKRQLTVLARDISPSA